MVDKLFVLIIRNSGEYYMVIKNKDVKEFIKKLYEQYSNEFVFRIRDGESIVYYNGIKAFTIKKYYTKHIKLNLFEEIFKCNPSAISEYKNNLDKYKETLKNTCTNKNGIASVCKFKMGKISFEISSNFEEEKINKRLDEFCEKYSDLFDSNRIKKSVKTEINRIKKESISNNKEIKDIERNKIELIFNTPLTDANQIIEVQFDFLNHMIIDEGNILKETIKSIDFNYKVYSDIKNATNDEIDIFISSIKDAIENYKGSDELEKKYQHQFMLSANTKKLFQIVNNKNVSSKEDKIFSPFEEEYYIKEDFSKSYFKKMDGNGRIDAIYIGEKGSKVTDIYLIELKVNENVVGGNNGIHKHLDNIRDLFRDEEGRKLFFKTILNRYEIRNQVLIDKNYTIENKDSLNGITYHFYTVIGFSDMPKMINGQKELIRGYSKEGNSHYDITIELLTKFKEENYSSLSKNELPDKYRKDTMSLLDIVKDIKDCNVELVFDINNWDKTTYEPNYKLVTNIYFKK